MIPAVKNAHQRFLTAELAILAWGASVQRANLYNPTIRREDREIEPFRAGILAYVEQELLPDYVTPVSEQAHISNIQKLVDFATASGAPILGPLGYKFGVAQVTPEVLEAIMNVPAVSYTSGVAGRWLPAVF